jgi:hypothetical protein
MSEFMLVTQKDGRRVRLNKDFISSFEQTRPDEIVVRMAGGEVYTFEGSFDVFFTLLEDIEFSVPFGGKRNEVTSGVRGEADGQISTER